MPKYQVTINEQDYPVAAADLAALDVHSPTPGHYHLLRNGKSYHVEVLHLDLATKTIALTVNGRPQELRINDETDQLVKKLGLSVVVAAKSKNAVAPMPGLVIDVRVAVGDAVADGTPLLILEAMKMENVLKSEGAGVVKSIAVTKGDAVEKKQLLIEIE
jgi:biotin carboxyl carrier protein